MSDNGSKVTHLAARGDGVTADGRYVAGALPGDVVRDDVIIPGPHHVPPACAHFGVCGGCQLQHADEKILGDFVAGRIVAALAGIDTDAISIHPVHLSPPHSRRRAAMRAEQGPEGLVFGFNREGSREIIDLRECPVLTPELFICLQSLRAQIDAMLPRGRVCAISVTQTDRGFDAVITNLPAGRREKAGLADWAKKAGVAETLA